MTAYYTSVVTLGILMLVFMAWKWRQARKKKKVAPTQVEAEEIPIVEAADQESENLKLAKAQRKASFKRKVVWSVAIFSYVLGIFDIYTDIDVNITMLSYTTFDSGRFCNRLNSGNDFAFSLTPSEETKKATSKNPLLRLSFSEKIARS